MAEGDLALGVDDVVADTVVVVELAVGAGSSLGQRVVDGGRGGAVGPLLVVEAGEQIEQCLELAEGGRLAVMTRRAFGTRRR